MNVDCLMYTYARRTYIKYTSFAVWKPITRNWENVAKWWYWKFKAFSWLKYCMIGVAYVKDSQSFKVKNISIWIRFRPIPDRNIGSEMLNNQFLSRIHWFLTIVQRLVAVWYRIMSVSQMKYRNQMNCFRKYSSIEMNHLKISAARKLLNSIFKESPKLKRLEWYFLPFKKEDGKKI